MTMLTPGRFIRVMARTPRLLTHILREVSQEQALSVRDGEEGWTIVEIVCHLRDFEAIFFQRAQQMVAEHQPHLHYYDHEALAIERDYNGQDLRLALDSLLETRAEFLAWLKARAPEDWERRAIHPENGEITLLQQAMQVGTHDIDHLEQIARSLENAGF